MLIFLGGVSHRIFFAVAGLGVGSTAGVKLFQFKTPNSESPKFKTQDSKTRRLKTPAGRLDFTVQQR